MVYYPEIRTLADVPRFHREHRPDDTALIFEDRETNYRQFDAYTNQVANGLVAIGCEPQARVGYIGKNSDYYFETVFGAAKACVVMVPINWRLAPPEIDYIVRDAGITVLFLDAEFVGKIADLKDRYPALKQIVITDGSDSRFPSYAEWRNGQSDIDPKVQCDPDDIVLQLYTSGTTGYPKGVQLPHGNFYVLEKTRLEGPDPDDPIWAWNVWQPDDCTMVTMPCFHISGTGWGIVALYCGAKCVILSEFSEEDVLDTIENHGITKLILVPTAIQMVVRHPKAKDTDFSSLRYMCYGASPIPVDLLKEAIELFDCGFVQMYGLTESTGAVTFLPPEDHDVNGNERMRSAGRPTFGVELKIIDPEANTLKPGEIGEICFKSPTIMHGYWNMLEETRAVITDDGWLKTGDAGYLDEDGYVYLQDRVKDMIVSGGTNVYPAEIENALYSHPDIAEVAVIGVPDEKWGEAVKGIVVLQPGVHPDAESILAFARTKIAGYKIPKSIEFVKSLPKNASGKVLKRELRKSYWAGHQRHVN